MSEKRETEHRLSLNVAKNEELEGKLKRLAEGMMMATSKISDLESRLAEKEQSGGGGEARSLATKLDVAAAADEQRASDAPDMPTRIAELEERLAAQAREHEEALARAVEDGKQRLQASQAKCKQMEERLAKQKGTAAAVEAATLELFVDLQEQVAAKDREIDDLMKKLAEGDQRTLEAEGRSRDAEEQIRNMQPPSQAESVEQTAGSYALATEDTDRVRQLQSTFEECRQQISALEADNRNLEAKLAEQVAHEASTEAVACARMAELQAEMTAKDEQVRAAAAQLQGYEQRERDADARRMKLEQQISQQCNKAADVAADLAGRVAELEGQLEKKDVEREEVLGKAVEEGRQRLQVFETLCEELSQQLEEQRKFMASSDADNAERLGALEAELASQRQLRQRAEMEAKYSEKCLKVNEAQTGQLQAELVHVREDAAAEASQASARIAELEEQISGQQSALEEVLARRAEEHTQRLQVSEARGHELRERLARLSTPAARAPLAEVAAQTESTGGDSDVLREALQTACRRLGADWAQWLRGANGRRLIVPAWRGVYLSFPKAEDAGGAAAMVGPAVCKEDSEEDGVPAPPGSDFWDWPLSRREKHERAVFVDRQMLLADQRALMEHTEEMRSSCAHHGVEVVPYLWDCD